jgi:hypothetical protein
MKGTRRTLRIFLVVMVMTAGLVGAAEEQPLYNTDIIKLTKLAMGDEVIMTKIKTAKEVKFDTSTDDLVKLKESGVSGPVIAAMLERSASGTVSGTSPATGPVTPKVALVAKEGTFDIKPIAGDSQTVFTLIGMRRFVQFSRTTSATRIKDRFPTLLLYVDRDPHMIWWVVKLKPWDDKGRILDLQSVSMFGGTISNAPDESCNVQYAAIEEKPGLWRITPKGELMPGEYGLFRWGGDTSLMTQTSSSLSDFGVDK